MKRALIVGLVAGFVAGLVQAILDISGVYELFSTFSALKPLSIKEIMVSQIVAHSLWGIVWGGLFAFFYNHIPAEGVRKGVFYGLIVWIVATIYPASIAVGYGFHKLFIPWLLTWFISICLVYGALIGILYKKK